MVWPVMSTPGRELCSRVPSNLPRRSQPLPQRQPPRLTTGSLWHRRTALSLGRPLAGATLLAPIRALAPRRLPHPTRWVRPPRLSEAPTRPEGTSGPWPVILRAGQSETARSRHRVHCARRSRAELYVPERAIWRSRHRQCSCSAGAVLSAPARLADPLALRSRPTLPERSVRSITRVRSTTPGAPAGDPPAVR
jgi:hypothetical protein